MNNDTHTFFTQIGPTLAEKITDKPDLPSVSSFLRGTNIATLYLKPVDEEEVKTTILSCKNKNHL